MQKKIFFNIQYIILLLIVFTIPIHRFFFPKLFVLLVAVWLLERDFKMKFKRLRNNNLLFVFIVFCVFYFLYIIGMTYSANIDFGITDLILKAPILLAPLIIFTMDIKLWDFQKRKMLATSFVMGCLVMIACSIYRAISQNDVLEIGMFLYTYTSWWHHPTYLAMYYSFSVFLITYYEINYEISFSKKIITVIINALLITEIVLLSSKSGYVSVIFLLLLACFMALYMKSISKSKILYPIFFILLFFIVFVSIPSPQNRFIKAIKVVDDVESMANTVYENSNFTQDSIVNNCKSDTIAAEDEALQNVTLIVHESSFSRIQTWKNSFRLAIRKLPFGTGTGDIRDDLQIVHQENILTQNVSLNAHCQFLQVFATLGILGIISFLACFFVPIKVAFQKKYFLYIAFIGLIFTNFLVESMLEVQAGVSFYAIFNGLLLLFAIARYKGIEEE